MRYHLQVFLSQVPLPGLEGEIELDFVSPRNILSYLIKSLRILRPEKIHLITEKEEVFTGKDARLNFITQKKEDITTRLVKGKSLKKSNTINLLLLSSDLFPANPEVLLEILGYHLRAENDVTLVGERVEEKNSVSEDCYVYSGLSIIKISKNDDWPDELSLFNKDGQVEVVGLVEAADRAGKKIGFKWLSGEEAREFKVIDKWSDLPFVAETIRKSKVQELLARGVLILAPEQVWISPEVKIAPGTVIYPFVILEGDTKIGKECQIFPHCHIINSRLGQGVKVFDSTVMENCRLDDGVQVGPFTRLRPETHLLRGSRVGNFVEMKKTRFGRSSKAMHLTYLGDATVGDKVNVGAGTITCNYDGVAKHKTYIGAEAFIGSGTELVAPVKVGRRAYVAAGSTITEDISPEALAIARARQVEKPGWVKKRKKELAKKVGSSTSGK
ncbi:MAG: UDP-N-acetylglucosamine diphosphorylase/glucosamine-1-phosphate N-acetyltransferase [Candidatus Aminicenantes bacterium]|nr:UDP-N-acetylglucosamine diphosphorylase/glucosamine-1-phosphate N-acetyltransferase [Candidatus Aminicenantes bacterium]